MLTSVVSGQIAATRPQKYLNYRNIFLVIPVSHKQQFPRITLNTLLNRVPCVTKTKHFIFLQVNLHKHKTVYLDDRYDRLASSDSNPEGQTHTSCIT